MKTIFVALLSVSAVAGFGSYRDIIPNGRTVPNPCNGGFWQAVGHPDPARGGQRNSFANDFDAAGRQWNVRVCQADSDGDGITNGEELGDPNCTWQTGQRPLMAATGHPGICEPIDSPACIQVNTFLNSGNCQRLSQQVGNNVNPTTPDQCISPCVCLPQNNPANTDTGESMENGESVENAESGPDRSEEFGRRKRDTNWWRQRRQQRRRQQKQNQNVANRQSLAGNTCDCVCPI